MKRRIVSRLLALVLVLAIMPVSFASGVERGAALFERIIEPQYEDAGMFYDGLAAVKRDGKWGYIDLGNNVVIDFQFDYASVFSEGYAIVGRLGTGVHETLGLDPETGDLVYITAEYEALYLGFISKNGEYRQFRELSYDIHTGGPVTSVLRLNAGSFDFSRQLYFYGGWANISNKNYDTNGNRFRTADNERYAALHVPTEGLVAAWDTRSSGYGAVFLDLGGNVVIDLRGYRFYDENDNFIANTRSGDRTQNYDHVRYVRYISGVLPFNQGLAAAVEYTHDYDTGQESALLGFIDRSGRWVISPQFFGYWRNDTYGEHRMFNDGGLASLSRDALFGAINMTGSTVIPFQYNSLRLFQEGLAPFERAGLFGYVDTAGREVIPARFRETGGFNGGVAVAYDGVRAFLIDRTGGEIPGSAGIDFTKYIIRHDDGTVTTYTPDEYVTIFDRGLYGFGRLTYMPPLPEPSEMDIWAYDEVIKAIEEDLVPAPLQNMFRTEITRRDFSRLIVHALSTIMNTTRDDMVLERTGRSMDAWARDSKFNDTTDRDVIAAEALGVVTGYDEGGVFTFRPHSHISRQEAAVMLWRAARVLGMDTASTPPAADFNDRGSLASWSVTQVDYVYSAGIMLGVGDAFDPAGRYTRQQSYMTIHRLMGVSGQGIRD